MALNIDMTEHWCIEYCGHWCIEYVNTGVLTFDNDSTLVCTLTQAVPIVPLYSVIVSLSIELWLEI